EAGRQGRLRRHGRHAVPHRDDDRTDDGHRLRPLFPLTLLTTGAYRGRRDMEDISGKTAIVTGAASGIGLGIATALAEAGANVVLADIQKDAVVQAAHGLSGTNKRVMPVRIDVTQEQSVID